MMYINFSVADNILIILGVGLSILLCYSALGRENRVTYY